MSRFVSAHITSLVQLEVLLLLHAAPQRAWDIPSIARELRIDPEWAAAQVTDLISRGLVTQVDGSNNTYVYRPNSADLAATIDELAKVYAQRRVTLITLIFSKPVDKIRTFADAFRIRQDGQSPSSAPPPSEPPHGPKEGT